MKKRLSILVLGEQRYMAGPLLPWKRRKLQGH
jgi:hypothetical protein